MRTLALAVVALARLFDPARADDDVVVHLRADSDTVRVIRVDGDRLGDPRTDLTLRVDAGSSWRS